MRPTFLAILCFLAWNSCSEATGNLSPGAVGVHRRFEYKYSFKPPYLAQKDGTVPFWEYGGSEYGWGTQLHVSCFGPLAAARPPLVRARWREAAKCTRRHFVWILISI